MQTGHELNKQLIWDWLILIDNMGLLENAHFTDNLEVTFSTFVFVWRKTLWPNAKIFSKIYHFSAFVVMQLPEKLKKFFIFSEQTQLRQKSISVKHHFHFAKKRFTNGHYMGTHCRRVKWPLRSSLTFRIPAFLLPRTNTSVLIIFAGDADEQLRHKRNPACWIKWRRKAKRAKRDASLPVEIQLPP